MTHLRHVSDHVQFPIEVKSSHRPCVDIRGLEAAIVDMHGPTPVRRSATEFREDHSLLKMGLLLPGSSIIGHGDTNKHELEERKQQ